jgi:4-hydroxythreonine-4-phosphate dehydrogenase
MVSRHSIGITMGDPAGIGPEISLKALHALSLAPIRAKDGSQIAICLYGDARHCLALAQTLGLTIAEAQIKDTGSWAPYPPATVSENAGQASAAAVIAATLDCLAGRLSAVVTAPIHKEAWHRAGVSHPGHTEMLAALSGTGAQATPCDVRMMLLSSDLCVVLDSIHLPLRQALAALDTNHLVQTLSIAQHAAPYLGLRQARIVLAALNPHASDNGLFGTEEKTILEPAIMQARARGIPVYGPLPADTAFMKALGTTPEQRAYDLVVCLYHDQGLIPMKLRGIDEGVNITLGLPFVRTSVDHGTAFDIAGKNCASPDSLLAAIHRAASAIEHEAALDQAQ